MPTPLFIYLGAFAVLLAMSFAESSSRYRPGNHRLEMLTAVGFAILAMVLLVSGGYRWGHNSAAEDAQRSAATTERK